MWILPRELQEKIWTYGSTFLLGLIAIEIFGMVMPARFLQVFPFSRLAKMDQAAHIGGYLAGSGCGYALTQRKKAEERRQKARGVPGWLSGPSR